MSLALTDEQRLLKDSVDKFFQQNYDFRTRQALAASALGYSPANWKVFAELGWLALPFAEVNGGFGGGMVDVVSVSEALGRSLATEPFIECLILGGRLLESLGDEALVGALLPQVMAGDLQLALAHTERHGGGNPACVACRATRDGETYVITGEKILVLNGANADKLLVTARSAGDARDPTGIEVFIVNADEGGVTRRSYPTIDGMRAADVSFHGLRVPAAARIGDPASNSRALESVIDEAIVAFSAAAIGAMTVLNRDTVEYAKTRQQFGQPIGKFQALQFRMVDMWIAQQQAASALHMAALQLANGGTSAKRSASALKVVVGEASRSIGEGAVQIHAGIGTSDELRVGHYFKRLLAIEMLLGSPDYHLDRYATLMDEAEK